MFKYLVKDLEIDNKICVLILVFVIFFLILYVFSRFLYNIFLGLLGKNDCFGL